MVICKHRTAHAATMNGEPVYGCRLLGSCTVNDIGRIGKNGPMPVCKTCDKYEPMHAVTDSSSVRVTLYSPGVHKSDPVVQRELSEIERDISDTCRGLMSVQDLWSKWPNAGLDVMVNKEIQIMHDGRTDTGAGCSHRSGIIRFEKCQIGCQHLRIHVPVYGCDVHTECSPWRWEQVEKMAKCLGCKDNSNV